MRVVMMTEMSWQVNEEVSRDMTGEADGTNQGVDSRDGVIITIISPLNIAILCAVCPFVCLLHSGILWKRLKILSQFLHRTVAQSF